MHNLTARFIYSDKPSMILTFLPAGGSGDEAGGKDIAQLGVTPIAQVTQVDEPVSSLQIALRGDIPAAGESVQAEAVLSDEDRRLRAIAKDKSRTGQQRYENGARLIVSPAAREKAYLDIAMDASIEHVRWRICALKALSYPVKKQKALFHIAQDSKIPYKNRLASAEELTNPNRKQKALASIFMDPKLDIELSGPDPFTQDKCYTNIRYNFLRNLPEGSMRDYILTKIVQTWGSDKFFKIRFSYKSFEYIKDFASNEIVKEKLFDAILKHKHISPTFRNTLLSRKEYDDYKKDTVFYNRSIASLGFIKEKTLESIRSAIDSAGSIVSVFKKDTLLQIIAEKWILEPDAKIDPYVNQFHRLYQSVTSQEIKNTIITHILDNEELPAAFQDAVKNLLEPIENKEGVQS